MCIHVEVAEGEEKGTSLRLREVQTCPGCTHVRQIQMAPGTVEPILPTM